MADSIREQIMQLVKARFETIQTANGYETDLGSNVFLWRDLNLQPFAESELPACNIRDYREEHEPKISGRADHHHTLFVECELATGVTAAGGSIDGDKRVRKIISDVIKSIGTTTNGETGNYWTNAAGTKLAFNTLPEENQMGVAQQGKTIATAFYRFKIEYRTQRWNPYEQ